MKSAHLVLTSSTAAELEETLQRCLSEPSGRSRWIFGATFSILIQSCGLRHKATLGIYFVTLSEMMKRSLI